MANSETPRLYITMSKKEFELIKYFAEFQDTTPTALARKLILSGLRNDQKSEQFNRHQTQQSPLDQKSELLNAFSIIKVEILDSVSGQIKLIGNKLDAMPIQKEVQLQQSSGIQQVLGRVTELVNKIGGVSNDISNISTQSAKSQSLLQNQSQQLALISKSLNEFTESLLCDNPAPPDLPSLEQLAQDKAELGLTPIHQPSTQPTQQQARRPSATPVISEDERERLILKAIELMPEIDRLTKETTKSKSEMRRYENGTDQFQIAKQQYDKWQVEGDAFLKQYSFTNGLIEAARQRIKSSS